MKARIVSAILAWAFAIAVSICEAFHSSWVWLLMVVSFLGWVALLLPLTNGALLQTSEKFSETFVDVHPPDDGSTAVAQSLLRACREGVARHMPALVYI